MLVKYPLSKSTSHDLTVKSCTFIFTVHLMFFSFFCRLIFKCSCETVFKKKQLLFEHFHQNANKRVTSVFKCPECNSVFPQKHLLMQHFKVSLDCVLIKTYCACLSIKMYIFIHVLEYIQAHNEEKIAW